MTQKYSHSPHSPHSFAHSPGRLMLMHSPSPLCNRGGRVSAWMPPRSIRPARENGASGRERKAPRIGRVRNERKAPSPTGTNRPPAARRSASRAFAACDPLMHQQTVSYATYLVG